jgi:hypothetical protein
VHNKLFQSANQSNVCSTFESGAAHVAAQMHEEPDMAEVLQVQLEKSSTQRVEALKKAEMMEAACERAEAARADVGREALRVQTDADTHRVELEVRLLLKPFDPLILEIVSWFVFKDLS